MRIRPEHLEAFRASLRAGTPDRVLQDLRAAGIEAELETASRSIGASDSRGAATRLLFRPDGLPESLVQPSGATYRFEHDPQGLLTAIVHPGGERLEIGYDDAANVNQLVRPGLCRYDFGYSAERLSTVRFPDGHQTTLAYDGDGQLTAVTDRAGATTRYHRRDGRLHSGEDPLGRHTVYEADEAGALSAVRFADGSHQEYAYDPDERIAVITARDGTDIIQELDDTGALRAVRWPDGTYGEFDFDDDGNLVSARTEAREVRHTFSDRGDPLTEQTEAGLVEYRYDGDGRLAALATPHGDTLSYEYDVDGRISVVRDWEGRENRFVYAANGTLTEIHYGNGIVERQRYARLGRLAEAEVRTPAGVTVSRQRYEYDICERLVSVGDGEGTTPQRVRRFAYDAESRIIQDFDVAAGRVLGAYRYDRKGNLVGDGGKQIEVGLLDEPLRFGLRSIRYDRLGNAQTTPAPVGQITCSFRANGFLAELRSGERTWRYEYDAFCRRVLKTDGITTWRFGWAGQQLLWEEYEGYPGAGGVRRDYLFIPETVTPFAFRENGRTYWLQSDARGAVIRAFDDEGTIVWSADYDSFGRATESVRHISQPWRLLGQYHDSESGLHYNFARYYNPATRSYLSRDPLWFKPEATNYSYARNDPWNRADPFGTIAPLLLAAGAVALVTVASATVSAGIALWSGEDPVAAAVQGGLAGFGGAVGTLVAGPAGALVGGIAGDVAGAFVGEVVTRRRQKQPGCLECAARAAGTALGIDLALLGFGWIPGVRPLARVVGKKLLSPIRQWAQRKLFNTPLGFKSRRQFERAMGELRDALGSHGISDAKIGVRGSAATGKSSEGGAFRGESIGTKKPSDVDVFIESDQLTRGVSSSKNIPGFIHPRKIMDKYPALKDWSKRWSQELGREITPGGFKPGTIPEGMKIFPRWR